MSVRALGWVFEHSEERNAARLVLLALANRANDGRDDAALLDRAWPSIPKIVHETRLSRASVIDALNGLKDRGAIKAEGRKAWGTVVYRVVLTQGSESQTVQNLDPPTEKGSKDRTRPVQISDSPRPDPGPKPSLNQKEAVNARDPALKAGRRAQERECAFGDCDGSGYIEVNYTMHPCRCRGNSNGKRRTQKVAA